MGNADLAEDVKAIVDPACDFKPCLKQQGDEVVDDLIHLVNVFDSEGIETVVKGLSRTHRTLQQTFTRTFLVPMINTLAKQYTDGHYDARNESSCKWANEIKESGVLDKHFPFI